MPSTSQLKTIPHPFSPVAIFIVLIYSALISISDSNAQPAIEADIHRIDTRIQKLAGYGANPQGGVSRVGFSRADIEAREYMMGLMRSVGLDVRIDAAGNIIGRRQGQDNKLPPIAFGSHIDSVPDGGNYDGHIGVIGALEVMELLEIHNLSTRHPLEMIIFADEEGGLTGSAAMVGELKPGALERIGNAGVTTGEGINAIGGNIDRLQDAVRAAGDMKAFLELHIEQGAVLDSEGISIGVVKGIVGARVWQVTVTGEANHAGTTPMHLRRDALRGAARFIVAVNTIARSIDGDHVATIGQLTVEPGAPNVIPGKVLMSLEMRDLSTEKLSRVFARIQQAIPGIEKETGTGFEFKDLNTITPAMTDQRLQTLIADAARELDYSYKYLPSGAAHDAQKMALIAPMGMIFVPSRDGISHSPLEYSSTEDITKGINVLLRTILKIDELEL